MSFVSRALDEVRGQVGAIRRAAQQYRQSPWSQLDAIQAQQIARAQQLAGGGGGGGGGVSTLEPTLQAYLRQIGFSEAQARAQAQLSQDEAARRLTTLIPAMRDAGVEQRRNIEGGMEDRGLYRSGETQRRLATQRREEERGVYDAQLGAAGGIAGSEADLAWRAAELANQRREYT